MAIAITSIDPATGPATGGTEVTITGTQLDLIDHAFVGGVTAVIVSKIPTTLVIKTPAHAAGSVAVQVVDDGTNVEVAAVTPFVYTAVVAPEKLVSTGASKWALDVDSSSALDGTGYIPVRAMKEYTPTVSSTTQDDSDYDGDGWGSDTTTQRKFQNTLKLGRKKGIVSQAYDPGQEVLRAASDQLGEEALVRVRWYDRAGGPEAYEGFASVEWAEDGGDTTALSTATVTLHGNGKRTTIVNPLA